MARLRYKAVAKKYDHCFSEVFGPSSTLDIFLFSTQLPDAINVYAVFFFISQDPPPETMSSGN